MDATTLDALEGRARPQSLTLRDAVDGLNISSGAPNSPKLPPPAQRILPPSRPAHGAGTAATADSTPDSAVGAGTRAHHSHSLSHAPAPSLADIAHQTKRMSLNFPPPGLRDAAGTRSPRPLSLMASPVLPPIQASPSPDREVADSPTGDNFLTHIAAQERRVLELREELGRAERELQGLKKQWAQHEVQRKRQDAKRTTQLKPLQPAPSPTLDSGNDSEDVDGSNTWMQQEMERRKSLLGSVQRSNRRVFSGSRHTRTLSLLSPDRTHPPSFPQPPSLTDSTTESSMPPATTADHRPLVRSATTASLERGPGMQLAPEHAAVRPSLDLARLPSDAILRTGKQMATDLKDGLWTFFEDIRQATVGEEAISGTPTHRMQHGHVRSKTSTHSLRRHGSRQSLGKGNSNANEGGTGVRKASKSPQAKYRARQQRPMSDAFDIIGGDFWSASGIDDSIAAHVTQPRKTPKAQQQHARGRTPIKEEGHTHSHQRASSRDSEAWDTWDTPASKSARAEGPTASSPAAHSESSAENDNDTSIKSTPRTSTSSAGAALHAHAKAQTADDSASSPRDAIPWPALTKLTPGSLKRTASNLMSEWERSISPSGAAPHASVQGHSEDGRDAGADAKKD